MLSQCQRPEVGAVGARLYYEDGTIQHAGVIIGMGWLLDMHLWDLNMMIWDTLPVLC